MKAASKPFLTLTAEDIMTKEVVPLSQNMPLREAAGLLLHNQISGAPVVDAHGRCFGVLSAIDLLRLGARKGDAANPIPPPMPLTCPVQTKRRTLDRGDVALCVLPPGVCPIQVKQKNSSSEEMIFCGEPHCVLVDWQLVEMEKLPTQDVRQFMTADPVTVSPPTSVRVLARMMIDAHIHRVIVVDDQQKPIGIVAGTDILAAVTFSEGDP